MAVVTTKSGSITNRDASPKVLNNPAVSGANLKGFVGTLESVSGDSIASKYIFGSIPSNAVVHQLRLYCDDVGTTTIADIGLYRTTVDGGAVVDADFFGSAVSLKDGAINGTDITHESAVFDPDDAEKPLWQALGLSADPCVMYDVVATLTAASDAAGTITLKGIYA
jgi:hypothetical protein